MASIVAISWGEMVAITDDDRICEITNLFDGEGEETDDPGLALSAVVKLDDDNWLTIDLTVFESASVN